MRLYIKTYLLIWIIVLFVDLLLPVSSVFSINSKLISLFFSFFYISVSIFFGVFIFSILTRKRKKRIRENSKLRFNQKLIRRIISLSSLLAIIGLLCFAYDKIVVQGLDYSNGIAAARHQFIDQGSDRQSSISSIYSVLGYFFCGYSFISLFFAIIFKDLFSRTFFVFNVIISVIAIMGVSVLTGGRTSIIIIVTIFWASILLRSYIGFKGWFLTKKQTLHFLSLFLVLFFYNLYVFSERARTVGDFAFSYMDSMVDWMQGKLANKFSLNEESLFSEYAYFFIILCVYLTHSNWIFEGVLETDARIGSATFNGFRVILSKLRMVDPVVPWEFDGRFICWPGGLFYDFGFIGVFFGAIFHGLCVGIVIFQLRVMKKVTLFNSFLFLILFSITVTSPFIILVDVLMFPPMVISFLFLIFVLFCLGKKIEY